VGGANAAVEACVMRGGRYALFRSGEEPPNRGRAIPGSVATQIAILVVPRTPRSAIDNGTEAPVATHDESRARTPRVEL